MIDAVDEQHAARSRVLDAEHVRELGRVDDLSARRRLHRRDRTGGPAPDPSMSAGWTLKRERRREPEPCVWGPPRHAGVKSLRGYATRVLCE
jgi:hypothetical protein